MAVAAAAVVAVVVVLGDVCVPVISISSWSDEICTCASIVRPVAVAVTGPDVSTFYINAVAYPMTMRLHIIRMVSLSGSFAVVDIHACFRFCPFQSFFFDITAVLKTYGNKSRHVPTSRLFPWILFFFLGLLLRVGFLGLLYVVNVLLFIEPLARMADGGLFANMILFEIMQ